MNFLELIKKEKQFLLAIIALAIILLVVFLSNFIFAPKDFKEDSLVVLNKGATLQEISVQLERENIIPSPAVFSRIVAILGGQGSVQAGSYYFQNPQNAFVVAKRVLNGEQGLDPVKITIPEGYTRAQISELFSQNFERFDAEEFLEITKDKEGYLFPDTYFFFPDAVAEDVMVQLEDNFRDQTLELNEKISESQKSLQEIITMASIVEAEAHNFEDMQKIAGVLWKRLEIGMPLQVDVTFRYINGKDTFDLTYEDLELESPYNTYVYTGLPPTPISNPGLDAVIATIDYISSDYLFFLADKSGTVHYSKTFEEHRRKKGIYLQ